MGILTKFVLASCIGVAGSYEVASHLYPELAKEKKQVVLAGARAANFLFTGGKLIALYTLVTLVELALWML